MIPGITGLVLTEPHLNLENIRSQYDEVVFEEYGFERFLRTTSTIGIIYIYIH